MTRNGVVRKRADWISFLCIAAHLSAVFLPVVLAAIAGPSAAAFALWFVFGVLMHGALNLMHEASHYHVFRARRDSDLLGRWLLGPLTLADFDAYRQRHWDHHRFLGDSGDTKDAYHQRLESGGWLHLLVRCLMLREAWKKIAMQAGGASGTGNRRWLYRTVAIQSVVATVLLAIAVASHGFSVAALAAWVVAHVFVYAYGLASLTPFVAVLRTVAEHQQGRDGAPAQGRAALRNFRCGRVERLVFGAYGFAEHASHHLEPALPCYALRAAASRHLASGAVLEPRSYRSTLRSLTVRSEAGAMEG